jgi:hypothetical protein
MTMLDLGFSGTALGVASAASGFVADPLAGADGVAGFCPPCAVVPPVAGVEGDAFGVFWLEVEGVTLGLVAEVPGLEGDAFGVFWLEVAGATLGLVAEVPGLEGDAFGLFWLEVAGATLGLVAEVPGAVAAGGVAAAGPLGPVSAFAGKANTMAKNGMATRPRNCGKKAEKRICSTLVAQNPIARRPLR